MHFFTEFFLTQILKRSTSTDLHHPDLHLAQFFSLESLKIFSAYAKTSLGLKMEKIPPDYNNMLLFKECPIHLEGNFEISVHPACMLLF